MLFNKIHDRIKKGKPHGHRWQKNQETKNILRLTNQRRNEKRDFQGIHDRFTRDPQFRVLMIENHRDDDLCRRWNALADEDHTHHLTAQEYSLYKSTTHRPDFKQALSTIKTRTMRRTTGCLLTLTNTNNGRPQFIFFYMVELARFIAPSIE